MLRPAQMPHTSTAALENKAVASSWDACMPPLQCAACSSLCPPSPSFPTALVDKAVTNPWLRSFLDLECFILSGMTAKDTICAGVQPGKCTAGPIVSNVLFRIGFHAVGHDGQGHDLRGEQLPKCSLRVGAKVSVQCMLL